MTETVINVSSDKANKVAKLTFIGDMNAGDAVAFATKYNEVKKM